MPDNSKGLNAKRMDAVRQRREDELYRVSLAEAVVRSLGFLWKAACARAERSDRKVPRY